MSKLPSDNGRRRSRDYRPLNPFGSDSPAASSRKKLAELADRPPTPNRHRQDLLKRPHDFIERQSASVHFCSDPFPF
jgi:hypothetical protein